MKKTEAQSEGLESRLKPDALSASAFSAASCCGLKAGGKAHGMTGRW